MTNMASIANMATETVNTIVAAIAATAAAAPAPAANTQIIILIGVIALVLAAGGGLWLALRRRRGAAGQGGEAGGGPAVAALRGFARSNNFRFICPATLAKNGRTASLDALAVGYFGVLGIISLPQNGEVYGSAGEKEWLQISPNGQRNRFPNPIAEASVSVRVIRDVLAAPKLRKVPVEVLCVFTSPKLRPALPRSLEYFTVQSFKKRLGLEKYLEDCGLDLDEVENALRGALENTR